MFVYHTRLWRSPSIRRLTCRFLKLRYLCPWEFESSCKPLLPRLLSSYVLLVSLVVVWREVSWRVLSCETVRVWLWQLWCVEGAVRRLDLLLLLISSPHHSQVPVKYKAGVTTTCRQQLINQNCQQSNKSWRTGMEGSWERRQGNLRILFYRRGTRWVGMYSVA